MSRIFKIKTEKITNKITNNNASLAKWLSVRLRTKWFRVRVQLQYLRTRSFPGK